MKNRKGLSDVVSNVLIILIVVAAVAILGLIVVNLVKSAGSGVTAQATCQTLDIQVTSCQKTSWTVLENNVPVTYNGAIATVMRGSGDANIILNKVTFNFERSDTTTVPIDSATNLVIGGVTQGNMTSGVSNPTMIVSVTPVVSGTDANGDPITCAIAQAKTPCN